MKKLLFLMLASMTLSHNIAQNQTASAADVILGIWTNPEKDAHFEIYKKENKYYGKIIWGTGGDTKDSKNPDPKLRSRDLVGLTILRNFEFSGKNTWSEDTIYDPKKGKTYSCTLSMTSANKLEVRGYVGISAFGRTETWTRIVKN
jgi:uncharacterized protein (DUF2147 family)